MSFPAPPPIGGRAFSYPNSANMSREDLSSDLQSLNLGSPARTKKKRPARAFHTEFNSPTPSVPSTPLMTPNVNQQQFSFDSPGFTSPLVHGNQAFPVQAAFSPQQPQTVPHDMTNSDNVDLSLQEYRYFNQKEFVTPNEQNQLRSFLTFQNVTPPDSSTQFHSVDQGTASSKFIRSTMYYVPESEQLRLATKLPIAVTVRPFAPVLPTEEPIPVVDMTRSDCSADSGDNGPIRCRRCRAYVNPSMQFTNNARFTCNICQFPNNIVPSDYDSLLDNQGYRVDKFIRPELHKGVYDLLVPKEYNFGGAEVPSNPLHHVFLIDISEQSIKQNMPVLIADAIRATLYQEEYLEYPEAQVKNNCKFAIIAFDKRIHFFNLSPTLETTQMTVSSDLDDPFVPFNEGLFVDPEESRMVIEDALNHLEQLGSTDYVADSEPCFAVACRTAMLCLQSVGGGKITSLLSALPTWGPGSLKYKDNKAVGRTPAPEVEQKVFLPDNDYFKLLAKDFAENNVGLDVHVVAPTSVDLSNIGWLASVSGGSISRWANFDWERDGRALSAKFVSSVKKTRGYQSQFKLRCSNGLQVSQYYGTSSTESTVAGTVQDPVIPILNEDQTFTVLLQYDGKLSTKLDCHFQAAMLFTDPEGVRKVRVINLVLAVSERLEDVFNFADENAIVTTIIRDTLSYIGKQPLTELRESINEKLVEIFTQYRAMSELGHNRNRTLTNQLLFPDSLKHLPQYLLAFIKSKAIRSSTGIPADTRLADMFQMLNMPVERLMYHLYPALVELHSLEDDEAMFDQVHGFINLPKFKDLSANNLEYGAYILCDGIKVYVWVDPNANIMLVKDLFGNHLESVEEISPLLDELPELPTRISEQARNIIKYFQSVIVGSPSLGSAGIQIVRPGIDGAVIEFKEALSEDSLNGSVVSSTGPSYPDYLSNLHKAIRVQLDSDKSSNRLKKSVNMSEQHDTLAQRLIHY
jgi:protein transport protein SEC24